MIKGEKEYEEKQTKKQIYSVHNGDCAVHGISACDNCKCKRQSKKSESEKIIKVCQEYWRERHPYNPLDR